MSEQRVAVGPIEIAAEERGAWPGPPLVLVHGYTGFWQDFEIQIDALAATHRVLAPDLRGHGGSTNVGDPEGYTLEALTGDLCGWLDALGIERCHLLGHSMGGMLAQRIALDAPERLASLVLMDTSPDALHWIDLDLIAKAEDLANQMGMEVLAQVLRARAGDDSTRSAADRRVETEWGEERYWAWRTERILAMDPAAYGPLARAMAGRASDLPRLAQIDCPTTVLVGADDEHFVAPSEAMAKAIPGAQLAVLPDASHQPQNENPGAWLEAMRAHLAWVDPV